MWCLGFVLASFHAHPSYGSLRSSSQSSKVTRTTPTNRTLDNEMEMEMEMEMENQGQLNGRANQNGLDSRRRRSFSDPSIGFQFKRPLSVSTAFDLLAEVDPAPVSLSPSYLMERYGSLTPTPFMQDMFMPDMKQDTSEWEKDSFSQEVFGLLIDDKSSEESLTDW